MANVHDVAAYILSRTGPISAMKLQKLAYYSQAWSLVWDERPLFPERIEAWANGPVICDLYGVHRGQYEIREWPKGNSDNLDANAKETVDKVVDFYDNKTAQWLSDLTHREDPWLNAREGIVPGEPGEREITLAAMHEYYSSLS